MDSNNQVARRWGSTITYWEGVLSALKTTVNDTTTALKGNFSPDEESIVQLLTCTWIMVQFVKSAWWTSHF